MEKLDIKRVEPGVALPGGLVRLVLDGPDLSAGDLGVCFNSHPALVVGASSHSMLVRVPVVSGLCTVTLTWKGTTSSSFSVYAGLPIATEVNPVGNPAADRAGNIYVTFSGPRGATVPFSVYRLPAGSDVKEPFLTDIVNASGIAISADEILYISSRHTGTVYKSTMQKNVEKFAENLGIATGLALDLKGNLYVGDRGGAIHRLDPAAKDEIICEIEPSVSAFHLAVRKDDTLFVSGPTLATQDNIYEIGQERSPKVFFHGLGRPQGMTFDSSGRLLVAASYRGRRGIFAIGPDRQIQQLVSSPMLVGVLIAPNEDLILADSANLYRVPAGNW
ncbi:MAG: gluconolaconase [Acidobacteria bacterium]|nr:gluconolaconase [Acidobacteriota bacterium]